MRLERLSLPIAGDDKRVQQGAVYKGKLWFGVACYPRSPKEAGQALLLSLDPDTGRQAIRYKAPLPSPWIEQEGGLRRLTVELGFRGMAVHGETLYATLLTLEGTRFLAIKGDDVQVLPGPGVPLGPLASFGGHLWSAPVGRLLPDTALEPAPAWTLYIAKTPEGPWEPVSLPVGSYAGPVHGFARWGDRLVVAVGDGVEGFELWALDGGEVPEKLLDQGAQRFSLNPAVSAMAVWGDALYLGTGIPETEQARPVEGAELLAVNEHGWHLVTGQPRFSPQGLMRPLTNKGPGWGEETLNLVAALGLFREGLYSAWVRRTPQGPQGFELWYMDRSYRAWRVFQSGEGTVRLMLTAGESLFIGGSALWRLSGDPRPHLHQEETHQGSGEHPA